MKKVFGLVFSAALATTLISGCALDKEKSSEIRSGDIVFSQIDESKQAENFNKGVISNYDLMFYDFILEKKAADNTY